MPCTRYNSKASITVSKASISVSKSFSHTHSPSYLTLSQPHHKACFTKPTALLHLYLLLVPLLRPNKSNKKKKSIFFSYPSLSIDQSIIACHMSPKFFISNKNYSYIMSTYISSYITSTYISYRNLYHIPMIINPSRI